MNDQNYPKIVLQFVGRFFKFLGKVLYSIFIRHIEKTFVLMMIAGATLGFISFIYYLSQQPAETLEIEKEIVVDIVRADMSSLDNEPVAVVVAESGLNIEVDENGPIAAGDTIGIYKDGRHDSKICNTNVVKKTYEDISDVPDCFRIEQAYKP